MTTDYPSPFAFTGTIWQVVVEIGEVGSSGAETATDQERAEQAYDPPFIKQEVRRR